MLKRVFCMCALLLFQVFAHDDFIAQEENIAPRHLVVPETIRAYVDSENDLRTAVLNFDARAESYFILGTKLVERNQQGFAENPEKRERVIWGAQLLDESACMDYGPALLKLGQFYGPEGASPLPDLCQNYLERAIIAGIVGADDLYNYFVDEGFLD